MISQCPSVLDLQHSWEGCLWLYHWDPDILEGVLLLNGHISTFAFSPFGMRLCVWRGIGQGGEWRGSRINGHCPRKWIHWLFNNHDLPGSKNNCGVENIIIMHIIITVWVLQWPDCWLCPCGYWFFYFPCKNTKLWEWWGGSLTLLFLLTTPATAATNPRRQAKSLNLSVVFLGAGTQGMNQIIIRPHLPPPPILFNWAKYLF